MAEDLSGWIGRIQETRDVAEPGPIRRLAALLDHETPPWPPGALPPFGHWLYFLPEARQSIIGSDGHPARGGFLPPIALPRRMWAGGRIDYVQPVPLGAQMKRLSTIAEIADKSGASGPMTFVVVRHEIFVDGALAIREEQDIVYRSNSKPGASAAVPPRAELHESVDFRRSLTLGPVELFRYSALTFNGHRIHYDRDYATAVEGYPGLVVHGPFLTTLLIDNFMRWKLAAALARITYRARSPLFCGDSFHLCATASPAEARLWAQTDGGSTTMECNASFR